MNETFLPDSHYTGKKWYIFDVNQKSLGRVATVISTILQGKHKIDYNPAIDTGDYIIIINAKKIVINSENGEYVKFRVFCPGRPGSSLKKVVETVPRKIIESAVKTMLPKRTRSLISTRLKIYDNSDHPHKAQNPILL